MTNNRKIELLKEKVKKQIGERQTSGFKLLINYYPDDAKDQVDDIFKIIESELASLKDEGEKHSQEDGEAKGIPIFVFTAKDKISLSVLDYYRQLCRAEECPQTHISEIGTRIDDFKNWQKNNLEKVKNPD